NPCLTTAWSSAIRIFMEGRGRMAAHQWYLYGDKGSPAGFAADFEFPAQQRRPLLHAEEADGAPVLDLAGHDAAAVVPDGEHQHAPLPGGVDVDPRGVGVAHDVGQRLLEDPEERGVEVRVQHRVLERARHVALDARAALELVGLPLEGGDQPEV